MDMKKVYTTAEKDKLFYTTQKQKGITYLTMQKQPANTQVNANTTYQTWCLINLKQTEDTNSYNTATKGTHNEQEILLAEIK